MEIHGKLHTKITPLGYTKKRSKDITIKEQLRHIMRDEENILKLHDGINREKTDENIVLGGDYRTLISNIEGFKTMTSYDRDILNSNISKYRKNIEKYEKRLEATDKDDTKAITKLQGMIEENKLTYDKFINIRSKLVPNSAMIEYFEIKMSISNAQHILELPHNEQKDYFNIFHKHLTDFFDKNMMFGTNVLAVAHLDQTNAHIHSINKIQGGWSHLTRYYKEMEEFGLKNPFFNMILDITGDFNSKHSKKLKEKFGIVLDENTEYMEQLNFTEIGILKVRTKKKQKAQSEIDSFIKLPKSLEEIPNDKRDYYLRLALEANNEKSDWIQKNLESITYIDDKKHQIDILKQQLKDIFYVLETEELDKFKDIGESDRYIQKRIEGKYLKDKKRSEFLLSITENFNHFLEFIKDALSKLIYIPDLNQRKNEFQKLETKFDEFMKENIKNMNMNLDKDLKMKDFIIPTIDGMKNKQKSIMDKSVSDIDR